MVQIDMEMPHSCMECDYCYKTNVGSVCMNGDCHFEYVDRYTKSRHPGCPLIEVRKGKWITDKYGNVICSECGWCAPEIIVGCLVNRHLAYYKSNFCWHCGADMREET